MTPIILPRIEGGLNKTAFDASLAAFKTWLEEAVNRYVSSGGSDDTDEDIVDEPGFPTKRDAFSRAGVTVDYSMHCSPRVEYKPVSEMKSMMATQSLLDCEMDILDWTHKNKGKKDLFHPNNFFSTRGSRGVDPRCYVYGGKRFSFGGDDGVKPPLEYVREFGLT